MFQCYAITETAELNLIKWERICKVNFSELDTIYNCNISSIITLCYLDIIIFDKRDEKMEVIVTSILNSILAMWNSLYTKKR